jgi:hypothetical protein
VPLLHLNSQEKFELLKYAGTVVKHHHLDLEMWPADMSWVSVQSLLAYQEKFRSFGGPRGFEQIAPLVPTSKYNATNCVETVSIILGSQNRNNMYHQHLYF